MDISSVEAFFTPDNIRSLLENYRAFGPFLGILLPLLEAFIPILPLILFVGANAAAYGFFLGAFLSWIGTSLGAIMVFSIFRIWSKGRLKRWLVKSRKIDQTLHWVERHGFGPLFILFCIPFTPSSLVNVAAGLSGISFRSFLVAVMLGKMVMVFMISYVGHDWINLWHQPLELFGIIIAVVILWVAGKWMEIKMQKSGKSQEH